MIFLATVASTLIESSHIRIASQTGYSSQSIYYDPNYVRAAVYALNKLSKHSDVAGNYFVRINSHTSGTQVRIRSLNKRDEILFSGIVPNGSRNQDTQHPKSSTFSIAAIALVGASDSFRKARFTPREIQIEVKRDNAYSKAYVAIKCLSHKQTARLVALFDKRDKLSSVIHVDYQLNSTSRLHSIHRALEILSLKRIHEAKFIVESRLEGEGVHVKVSSASKPNRVYFNRVILKGEKTSPFRDIEPNSFSVSAAAVNRLRLTRRISDSSHQLDALIFSILKEEKSSLIYIRSKSDVAPLVYRVTIGNDHREIK
ncbi:MAG: hypothetical protein ACO1SV_25060 [Fimbriimonas sp.]